MSKERLLSILDESERLDNAEIRKIKEDFCKLRDRFLKPKIKEIRKNLYEIDTKYFSESKTKEIEKNLFELEESFSRLKKYHDYDDAEYKDIRDVGNLFKQSTEEDYYKPLKTTSALIILNMKAMEIRQKFTS